MILTFYLGLVNVKWGKEVYPDVELNIDDPVEAFKIQLFNLTNVPVDRQKIMFKGGILKDTWDTVKPHLTHVRGDMVIFCRWRVSKQANINS
jgi:hypothetical protein